MWVGGGTPLLSWLIANPPPSRCVVESTPHPPDPPTHSPPQLETTIGSVIKDFAKVVVMHVPRARYLPVKSTSDLFLVQSSLYAVSRGMLLLNPARCVVSGLVGLFVGPFGGPFLGVCVCVGGWVGAGALCRYDAPVRCFRPVAVVVVVPLACAFRRTYSGRSRLLCILFTLFHPLPPTTTTITTTHPNPHRPYRRMPLIKLGEHFTHIQDYLERVPNGIPDILCLEHLTVAGDVVFGANVTLKVCCCLFLCVCLSVCLSLSLSVVSVCLSLSVFI